MIQLLLVVSWLVHQVKSADCKQALATHDLVGNDFSCGDSGANSVGTNMAFTTVDACNTECQNTQDCTFFEKTSNNECHLKTDCPNP